MVYALSDNNLLIKITLQRKIDMDFGVSMYVIGYKKARDFASLPKLHISIGINGLKVTDKKLPISSKPVVLSHQGSDILLKVPMNMLGEPDYLLVAARTNIKDLSFDHTAWRVLEVEK